MKSTEDGTREWYGDYYLKKGKIRNDLLLNPEVLFQHLAFEESVVSALRRAANLRRDASKVLDVGCGDGSSLAMFLRLGFQTENLFGMDLLEERIDVARKTYPGCNLICGDAASMKYESNQFDLVMESTMFVQITDNVVSRKIAEEMLRVTKPGGYVMLVDWRYGKPGNPGYSAVSKNRINGLFSVGSSSDLLLRKKGALIPPVGRAISKYVPSVYFLIRAAFPFLAGSMTTLLQKRMS